MFKYYCHYWAVTSLVAATIALVQTDIKKVLAYSTVSQLGLMFLALGLGAYGRRFRNYTCFLQGLLVLRFGSVIHALHGEQDMRKMGGLKSNDNYIHNLLISSLAISGIPPFSGFSRKTKYYGSI
jgi:NADH-quinone oxidoreductase subunit L